MGDLPRSRKLVLASSSPRRRELLREFNYDFEIEIPDVPECARPEEAPDALAERLACAKADVIAEALASDVCVLAADTIVVLDDRIFGKPADEQEAADMLCTLAGNRHEVITGYCLRSGGARASGSIECISGVARSQVQMRAVARAEAAAYAATGEPLDKAGAYAVQGEGGRFVTAIEGLRSNVIGLPVEEIAPLLSRFGVEPR